MSSLRNHASLAALMITCALASGCAANDASTSSTLILDAVHGDGTEGFYFLPPMVPAPAVTGNFDATFLDELTVEIEEHDGSTVHTIATFSASTGSGSDTLRVDPAIPAYVVQWHTGDYDLSAGRTYRIRVLLEGEQLGFADVDVVSSGRELRNVATGEYVALLDGRTLPIQFRVEGDTETVPVGPSGAEAELLGGDVTLSFPPGAVSSDITVTVTPIEGAIPGMIAGTVFEFGPSPYTFGAPVTLTLAYPPGAGEPTFYRLVKLVGGGVEPVTSSRVDLASGTVSGEIGTFSAYAIEGQCPDAPSYKSDGIPSPRDQLRIDLGIVRSREVDGAVELGCWCGEGFGNCDWETAPNRGVANGCEADLWEDEANCGGCGVACAVGEVCAEPGTCITL